MRRATRRGVGLGLGLGLGAVLLAGAAHGVAVDPALAAIEAQCGGRLGVGVIDTGTGREAGHRTEERFPMCSTHKALSAAALLGRVDAGRERLDRRVRFGMDVVVDYSPLTKPHADADGMTLDGIAEAAVTLSDNTAGNLLFDALGGPAGVTDFLRGMGDAVTRLDRTEPTLNEAVPGDPRDTTTPLAMARTLRHLVLGDGLLPASRARLAGWLVAGRTGGTRLRAGVPPGWRVGDKTGTNGHGTANDVGILWPPGGGAPLVVTAFITGSTAPPAVLDAAIAAVARLVSGQG